MLILYILTPVSGCLSIGPYNKGTLRGPRIVQAERSLDSPVPVHIIPAWLKLYILTPVSKKNG